MTYNRSHFVTIQGYVRVAVSMSVLRLMFIEELIMAERVPAAVALREAERKAIEDQVKAFLEKGGKIEQVPIHINRAKPIGPVWQANYSGSLDSV